jgi:uncharacterized protein (TIGR02444 family)
VTAWAYAIEVWGRPGVEPACLELQDVFGMSVPLVLWRLWAVTERRGVTPASLVAAVRIARAWDRGVLHALRAMRNEAPSTPSAGPGDTLRRRLQQAELEAEHALFEELELLAPGGPAEWIEPGAALVELAAAWGAAVPTDRLALLVAAL